MMDQNSQQGSATGEKKLNGDYLMLTREVLKQLLRPDLTTNEKSIILHVADRTVGYHCKLREFSLKEFMQTLGLAERTLKRSLSRLLQLKILTRRPIGNRQFEYGLNEEFFGRIYPGELTNISYLDRYKKKTQKCHTEHPSTTDVAFIGATGDTLKVRRHAPTAAKQQIKHISNIVLNISLSRFQDFLNRQPRATRSRWERFLNETLGRNPRDEELLHCAIDLIHKEKKDLFGTPIYSSIIGLFEKSDWELMKTTLVAKLKKESDEKIKKDEQERTEKLAKEKRARIDQEMTEHSPEVASKEIGKIISMITGNSISG